ncbi:MAG: peptidylprolyl isomerase [Caldilineaceae bacterium]
MSEAISEEKVPATEEQVHARHILIRVMTPTLTITDTGTITAPITSDDTVTGTTSTTVTIPLTDTVSDAVSVPVTETVAVTSTAPATVTGAVTATSDVTVTSAVTATSELTTTDEVTTVTAVTGTVAPTATASLTETAPIVPPTPVERTDAEARALAEELRQRILAGEDFATLAQQYSDDTGSGAEGGDLGWFGAGRMVAPFEEAAFSLEVDEISEPIKTEFGYHIIEVLEKDEARPKDPSQLEQERQEAYNHWLQEEKVATEIERPDDLTALLPRDLR